MEVPKLSIGSINLRSPLGMIIFIFSTSINKSMMTYFQFNDARVNFCKYENYKSLRIIGCSAWSVNMHFVEDGGC